MKTIAIHQSQYLPWPPYFKKIANSDIFIFLDNVQFQKNGVQNRNKLRNKEKDFWLTIPINKKLDENIDQKKITDKHILKSHWKSIEQNYAKSKNWNEYKYLLNDLFMGEYDLLIDINQELISFFLRELDIQTELYQASTLNVSGKNNDLIIDICQQLNGDRYLTGMGALSYLNEDLFLRNDIKLVYLKSNPPVYKQVYNNFISGLSILDYFMNASKKEINKYFTEE